MSKKYVGNAVLYNIGKTDNKGATLTVNIDDLATYLAENPNEDSFQLQILPLKPENVTKKKTHSIKFLYNGS